MGNISVVEAVLLLLLLVLLRRVVLTIRRDGGRTAAARRRGMGAATAEPVGPRRRGARPAVASHGSADTLPTVKHTEHRSWLRQLDEDAFSGALWRRPLFLVPALLLLGALSGVVLGYFGSLALSFTLPVESVVPGPDGTPTTVLIDNSGVPILGGALGFALGLAAGGLILVRRWHRTR